jgi:glycine/serine hydroxymethyltransferase
MGTDEMQDVARFFARALLEGEDPQSVRHDVADFKGEFQTVGYCFEPGSAYPGLD